MPDPVADAVPRPEPGAPRPSAASPSPPSPPSPRRARAWAAAFAAILALAVGALAEGLPLAGDAVVHGALARSIAAGEGFALDGVANDRVAPLWPALLAVPVALGASVTAASRTLALLLSAVTAALTVVLARRVTRDRLSLPHLTALAGLHPALALHGGGLLPGPEGLLLALLLGAGLLALSERPAARRAACVLAALLPLVRFDAIVFPALVAAHLVRTRPRSASKRRTLLLAGCLLLPVLAWGIRTFLVSGSPLGRTDASHGIAFSNLPRNAVVILGLVVPAAALGLLLPFLVRGVRSLWAARVADRPVVRGLLRGVALDLLLVLLFAGPDAFGPHALSLSGAGLRQGILAVPFVIVAGLHGLALGPARWRRPVGGAVVALAAVLSLVLLSGPIQGVLPFPPLAAGRLHAVARAYDEGVREAGASDWIALDLKTRDEVGIEVFLGDRAPAHRTGVLVAAPVPAGLFPRAPLLPLVDALPKDATCVLVSDLPREGVIFTGDRPDLHVGGQGIFLRVLLREVDLGRAGRFGIHQIRRPRGP